MRWKLVVMVLAAAVPLAALSGCGQSGGGGQSPSPSAPSSSAPDLTGSSWLLASYAAGSSTVEAAAGGTAALEFRKDGAMGGSTGCNSFGGTFVQEGASLTITTGPMTLMACTDPAVDAQEKAVIAGLGAVASFRGGPGSELVLLDASGATLLTYGPGLRGLAGTSWRATGINNGKGAVAGTADTDKVTAVFGEAGDLSGSAGCNNYRGTWTASGTDKLAIGPLATTKKLCEPPLNALEQQYLTALATVTTYQINGTTLTLRDETGAAQATYRLDQP